MKKVGRDSGRCTARHPDLHLRGHGPDLGQGQGHRRRSRFSTRTTSGCPITGGTGAFKAARGQLTVEEGKKTFLVFELLRR